MPSYPVESIRQPMDATGLVDSVKEWEEMPDGRRRPSDKQARNEDTGMPLWEIEVMYLQTNFGQKSTVVARVIVEAKDEPKLAGKTPVAFTGLRVEVRKNKAGGWVEYWTAEQLLEPQKTTNSNGSTSSSRPTGEKAA